MPRGFLDASAASGPPGPAQGRCEAAGLDVLARAARASGRPGPPATADPRPTLTPGGHRQ